MPDNRRPGGPGMPEVSGRKSLELREPKYLRKAGRPADSDLAEELLKLIAIGVAGGVATIAGARKLGEGLQNLQERQAIAVEAQREKYRQAVRQAVANEVEIEYETSVDDGLTLTPSPLEEQPVAVDLVLEGSVSNDLPEISFEGQEEAEASLEEAMKAYDTAMDEAAGIL